MARRCSTCGNQTEAGFVTDTYTRKSLEIEVTISGIPAQVCPNCGDSFIKMEVFEEIDLILKPLFEAAKKLERVSSLKVTASFPALVPAGAK